MINRIKRITLLTYSLLLAGSIFCQTSQIQKRPQPVLNLSLWKNVSTQTDSTGITGFNLGLYSRNNRLNGVGINLLGNTVRENACGMSASGLFNIVNGDTKGIELAGITNINGSNLTGVAISGLVNITSNQMKGMMLSGLTNITGNNSRGAIFGGLLNFCGEEAGGFHLAGLADISGADFTGTSLAGFINIAGNNLYGFQVAGLASIVANGMTGLQLSGLSNIVGGKACGLQLSPLNMATEIKGVQIGLVNYYKTRLDGFQLGLVNANPNTHIQLMLFGGNQTKLNVGVRFKNEMFYTILGGGTHYLDFSDKFSSSFFYRAGLGLPFYRRFFISSDLGYQHIEMFKNKSNSIPARLYALQARVNIECKLSERFSLFCTGGYGVSRPYTQNRTFEKGPIWEGGIILF